MAHPSAGTSASEGLEPALVFHLNRFFHDVAERTVPERGVGRRGLAAAHLVATQVRYHDAEIVAESDEPRAPAGAIGEAA